MIHFLPPFEGGSYSLNTSSIKIYLVVVTIYGQIASSIRDKSFWNKFQRSGPNNEP